MSTDTTTTPEPAKAPAPKTPAKRPMAAADWLPSV